MASRTAFRALPRWRSFELAPRIARHLCTTHLRLFQRVFNASKRAAPSVARTGARGSSETGTEGRAYCAALLPYLRHEAWTLCSVGAAAMSSGIEFRVHPLVLLNLSDHYTRCVCRSAGALGAVLPARQLGGAKVSLRGAASRRSRRWESRRECLAACSARTVHARWTSRTRSRSSTTAWTATACRRSTARSWPRSRNNVRCVQQRRET